MRDAKRSSARSPTTAWHGTPAWRARTAISPSTAPRSARSSRRPVPMMTARAARIRASNPSASRTNRVPGSAIAPDGRAGVAPGPARTTRRAPPASGSGARAGSPPAAARTTTAGPEAAAAARRSFVASSSAPGSTSAVPPPSTSAKPSPVSPPSAGSRTSIVPAPPPVTGHRSGGANPPVSRPRPIAAAAPGARRAPPKGAGATRTGRSARGVRTITRCCSTGGLGAGMRRVPGDPRAGAARVVAPPLVAAVGGEEVAAARRVAEAHGVAAARADQLDRRRRDPGEQLVDRAGAGGRPMAELARLPAELRDDRQGAGPRVEPRRRPRREGLAVDGGAEHGLHVVAHRADLVEPRGRGAGADARHAARLALGPAREVRARAQVVVVDHPAPARRVGEVHRQRLAEPVPQRELHRTADDTVFVTNGFRVLNR